MNKPLVLVTNDDGIDSEGIQILATALKPLAVIYIVAPESEQSGVSHAVSLHRSIRIQEVKSKVYKVFGTPTDCVFIGVHKILPKFPDLIVSGINKGPNLGDDVTYSGTVSAAMEGTLFGINSIAISLAAYKNHNFKRAAIISYIIAKEVLNKKLPDNTFINVNIPALEIKKIKGIRITNQGNRIYCDSVREEISSNGEKFYRIESKEPSGEYENGSDLKAIKDGFISITPLHLDMTNYHSMKSISWLKEIKIKN